jgi:hypothetical protein
MWTSGDLFSSPLSFYFFKLSIMRIVFQKHTVRISGKYECKCGHKFTRINTDWFTDNPFNTKPLNEIRKDMTEKLRKNTKVCPKCQAVVKPKKQP